MSDFFRLWLMSDGVDGLQPRPSNSPEDPGPSQQKQRTLSKKTDYVIVKVPYHSPRTEKIIHRTNLALLRDRLNSHRSKKSVLIAECKHLREYFKTNTTEEDCNRILTAVNSSYQKIHKKQSESHSNKLNHLNRRNQEMIPSSSSVNHVVNLSSYNLSEAESSILNKELNFALSNPVTNLDLSCAAKAAASKLSDPQASEYRWRIRSMLEKSKPPKHNISPAEHKALHDLKTNPNIKILPADKGNCTIVLNTTDYQEKISDFLQNETYTEIHKDPTTKVENKIKKLLNKHKSLLPPSIYKKITPRHSKPPHLYGLPKVHKQDVPLRPIVSSIGSPCHALARFLCKTLTHLIGKMSSYVKNSRHFVDIIRNTSVDMHDTLVSFDVVSLFTNVPVDEALSIVRRKLEADNNISSSTQLSIESVMELLDICLKTTYFVFNNRLFQQNEGMAMGSPPFPSHQQHLHGIFRGTGLIYCQP
ncbi:hypothetical protein ANN_17365 [Periplaneta americana]|uniref:Reverse transcriptase domain-containing protein n=1 Tax=Periplaneta americana TaxID=6978 RepID=A0ABQ8SSR7_PERAM|nr:hypothetical protein ANN_17365 [Periplaneta americana]